MVSKVKLLSASVMALMALSNSWAQEQAEGQQVGQVKQMAARKNPFSTTEMILAATHAGKRIIAVGEHGTILLSDDDGKTFKQSTSVPTNAALTSVSFVDDKHGWAVGHWGTIVVTEDGGESWSIQRSDTVNDRPIFAVHFSDGKNGVAVGLWSLVLITGDGGKSWQEIKLPNPPDGGKADRNLFSIFAKKQTLYITAERGAVLRSDDEGKTWTYLLTNYRGSFWTGGALHDGTLLVAGLRGTVYRSDDDGKSWSQVDSGTRSSLTGVIQDRKKLVIVGLDGVVLTSTDSGRKFDIEQREDRLAFTAITNGANGEAVAFTKRGVLNNLMK